MGILRSLDLQCIGSQQGEGLRGMVLLICRLASGVQVHNSASVLLNHTDAERDNSALPLCVFWQQGQEMLNEALSPSPFLLGTGKTDSCMLSHLDTLMPTY